MIPEYVTSGAVVLYSIEYAMKASIIGRAANEITIRLLLGKVDMVRQNDPVIFMFMDSEIFHYRSASVLSVDYGEGTLKLLVAEDFNNEERRVFERYPVSMEVSARKKYQNKRFRFLTKNLSLYGLGVVSDTELEIDDQVDIDLIMKKSMLYFTVKIVWKKKITGNESNNEYGLHITDIDVATVKILDDYLKKIRNIYMEMYSKAK